VLEGALTFRLGDVLTTRRAGELAFAPPRRNSCLRKPQWHRGAGALIVFTPAGFERYFARMAAEHQGVDPPQWALQPIPDVTVVGSPIKPMEVE
jgi:hypothetical protein